MSVTEKSLNSSVSWGICSISPQKLAYLTHWYYHSPFFSLYSYLHKPSTNANSSKRISAGIALGYTVLPATIDRRPTDQFIHQRYTDHQQR